MSLPFYLICIALLVFTWQGWQARFRGWGIPSIMVLATASGWYLGDAVYNDYSIYELDFGAEILDAAWWQVLWFVIAFGCLVPRVSRYVNRGLSKERSHVLKIASHRTFEASRFQLQLDRITYALLVVWVLLMAVALTKVEIDFMGLFAPWLGEKAEPWARDRIGSGFDALLSVASYMQIFLVASFGVVAALSTNPKTRTIALSVCFLALPYYLFDRVRNTMLATVMPGFLTWVFLRLRGGMAIKVVVLLIGLAIVSAWFGFVMNARGEGRSVAGAFSERSVGVKSKHGGLNMYEELAWINSFIKDGTYLPNWGQRYFAELVNPVPRVLWKDKPTIGFDYALARGFGWNQAADSGGGIAASISTGMIGQGVVNFGRFLGPLAAAVLMAFWVSLLARQDLLGANPARLLLYATGMILTFNMGRDITLLVMYPFLFGLAMLWAWEKVSGGGSRKQRLAGRTRRRASGERNRRMRRFDPNGVARE